MPHEDRNIGVQDMYAEIRALDSKVRVIAQRMMVIEKNEQIIGKTLITHNKNIKKLTDRGMTDSGNPDASKAISDESIKEVKRTAEEMRELFSSFEQRITDNTERISELEAKLDEIKYTLDNINPVEYVKIDQLKEYIDERLGQKKA